VNYILPIKPVSSGKTCMGGTWRIESADFADYPDEIEKRKDIS
jgi:hypothetical protein